ncbi:hypothetical protein [uncultured Xanthomonas sp.]|uniref:hypothetical protein n=1 Tax=uncultured Xanthomonas sp. TaxID=152831 RepID=UPI0025DD8EA6|nr:hypothetical protein [uncultured Xanthomonas sp.]
MNAPLLELVELLSSGSTEPDERSEIVRDIEAFLPELEWTECEEQAYAIAITAAMERYSANGDKMIDVHHELCQMMGDAFPAFPKNVGTQTEYFTWLDRHLAEWTDEGDGYDVVDIDDMTTEDQHMFVVYRRDVPRILEIAASLGVPARRPLDYWRGLGYV